MASIRDACLENSRAIRCELLQLMEGMDYCLDWKPDPASWSVREVVYHLVDTPSGGIHSVLMGILSGGTEEFDLRSDLTNMTPERQGHDAERVQQDFLQVLDGLEQSLTSARDEDLAAKSAMVHQRNRGWDEPRTAQNLLEGLFARHWREHLGQIRGLKESLGV